jgi:hypothetical protein
MQARWILNKLSVILAAVEKDLCGRPRERGPVRGRVVRWAVTDRGTISGVVPFLVAAAARAGGVDADPIPRAAGLEPDDHEIFGFLGAGPS